MGTRLGQHFLKDKSVLARIAREALEGSPGTAIEVGPGHGELTDALLTEGAKHIIAIERDFTLAVFLRRKYQDDTRVEIVEGDVRKVFPELIRNSSYAITGNIPYYLTGYLLRLLGNLATGQKLSATKIVLLVQKEVAERACASPPYMNLLATTLQTWAAPKISFTVPRGAFSPPPKVTSALLILTPHPNLPSEMSSHYFETVRIMFRHPRKTLANNIREGFSLTKERAEALVRALGLKENARASLLTPEHIKMLVKMVYN
jgi:16S rRNA (adenine1518-N6/adenine1519-N6)-dimethyltransferase